MDIAYSALTGHYYLTEGRKRVDITEPMLAHDARKRAEVIDECIEKLGGAKIVYMEHDISELCAAVVTSVLEQLKEQKNGN